MKLKNILIIGLIAIGSSSCNDFLEVEAPSKYENDYVFSDRTEINRALNGVYAQLLSGDTYGSAYMSTFCLNSDVDMATNTSEVSTNNSYRRFDCTSIGGEIEKAWNAAYRGVEYANNFIYQLENSPLYNEEDEELVQMMGEAKVIRAMFYHDLVVMFGDIPFSMQPVAGADDNSSLLLPITDREEIHKQLIADLEAIAPKMQFAADINNGVERVSKEFCWAMIARMALTCGGYSLRPDVASPTSYGMMKRPDNYIEYYKKAQEYSGKVIDSGLHKLNLSYRQVFINECDYKVINNDDPIFEIPFTKNSSGAVGYIQGPENQVFEGNTVGKNIWGEAKGNARLSPLYRFLFEEGDLRRDYVNGLWYYTYEGEPTIYNNRTVFNNKWSKLWSTTSLGSNSQGNTGINYPYMRYADVLLMYAEAVNEVEGGVTGPNGTKAIDALRQVRNRAFAGNEDKVESYLAAVSSTKENFLKAVLDERKFEFAGENMRWKDLVRNNIYNEVIYYTFLRHYGAAEAIAGSSDYTEMVAEYDGKPTTFWDDAVECFGHYKKAQPNPGNINIYPNTTLDVLVFHENLYDKSKNNAIQGTDWEKSDFFNWWNETDGCPRDEFLYSFYGFIRGDVRGGIYVVRDGKEEAPSVDNLPVLRYILPYPNSAIQRSAGVYKNYYGY